MTLLPSARVCKLHVHSFIVDTVDYSVYG